MIVRPLRPAVWTGSRGPWSRPGRRRRSRRAARRAWGGWAALLVGLGLLMLVPVLAHAQQPDSVVVWWTAPGDDGTTGTAAAYDLRVSESAITAANFDAAAPVEGLPAPARAGTRQSVTVRHLAHGTVYYFAIRSADEVGNWSGISSVLRWDWVLDTAPPGTPLGVVAAREAGGVRVSWTPSPDPDLLGYRVYRATAAGEVGVQITASPVAIAEFLDAEAPSDATLWYRVSAVDVTGNESGRSAAASVGGSAVAAAAGVTLEAAYPNPSRAGDPVQIPVVIAAGAGGAAVIDVVDAGGRRVRRLERTLGAGRQEIEWDGRNDAGRVVVPGVYRAWLVSGGARTGIRLLRVP